jgi:hypothetical protein
LELHTVEPSVTDRILSVAEFAIAKFNSYKSPGIGTNLGQLIHVRGGKLWPEINKSLIMFRAGRIH